MKCVSCGAPVPVGASGCLYCRSSVAVPAFCGHCGHMLSLHGSGVTQYGQESRYCVMRDCSCMWVYVDDDFYCENCGASVRGGFCVACGF